jgi:uncharacterized membrane protein YfcA
MDAPLISDPVFYALAVPALLFVGISKGGFGGGVGMLGVPVLAIAIPLVQAAAIMLPILCLMDLFALAAYRRRFSAANVRALLPAALIGIAAGAWAFGALEERWIRGIVGLIAVIFALQYWLGLWRRGGVEKPPASPGAWSAALWGSLSGFTSTVAHAGGPPMSVYLLPQRLDRTIYVGTTVVLFTAINYLKLVPYGWLGQLHTENLATSLVLAPLAPLGIWLGRVLHDLVNETLFYRIAYALLVVVGAKLIWDGAALAG